MIDWRALDVSSELLSGKKDEVLHVKTAASLVAGGSPDVGDVAVVECLHRPQESVGSLGAGAGDLCAYVGRFGLFCVALQVLAPHPLSGR